MKPIKFNNGREMYDYLVKSPKGDLYSPSYGTYVFGYNDCGSIAYYSIDVNEAKDLANKCKEYGEKYWNAFLGLGIYICDIGKDYEELWKMGTRMEYNPNEENNAYWFCEECYMYDDWYDTNDYE